MADIKTKVDVRPRIAPREDVVEPKDFNVIYINDEVTTQEFVIGSLTGVFNYARESAEALTLRVWQHNYLDPNIVLTCCCSV